MNLPDFSFRAMSGFPWGESWHAQDRDRPQGALGLDDVGLHERLDRIQLCSRLDTALLAALEQVQHERGNCPAPQAQQHLEWLVQQAACAIAGWYFFKIT